MSAWGQITDLVLLALTEIGQGTYQEIAEHAEVNEQAARKALHRMSTEPEARRRVYVRTWRTDAQAGQRAYPRPVYAPGSKRNASRPRPKTHTASARESARRAQRMLQAVHPAITQKQAVALRGKINRART